MFLQAEEVVQLVLRTVLKAYKKAYKVMRECRTAAVQIWRTGRRAPPTHDFLEAKVPRMSAGAPHRCCANLGDRLPCAAHA